MNGRNFTSIIFLALAILNIPLLLFFKISPEALSFFPLLVLGLMIIGSTLSNVLIYTGLRNKDLSHLEPIRNSQSIISILLAFLIFPEERNIFVLLIGLITTLALIFANLHRHENKKISITFDKFMWYVLLSMIISSFINISYKYLLNYYSSISLYGIRAIGIFVLMFLLYRPSVKNISSKQWSLFFLSALFYTLSAILKFTSIKDLGVSITVLIFNLSPAIIYLFSKFLLKEKISKKKVLASTIIIGCILFLTFVIKG